MDSVSHMPSMIPAVPVQHAPGTIKVAVGDARQWVGKEPWHVQHILPPHPSLSPSLSSSLAAGSTSTHLLPEGPVS